eukprot:776007-Pleurochrysis_carterae.AAC.2
MLLFVSVGSCGSVSSCGGGGALMSSSIVFSITSVSTVVGAAGGAAYGTGGVAEGAGGVGFVSPGNEVSMKRECGTCAPAGFVPFLDRRMGQMAVRACEAAAMAVRSAHGAAGVAMRRGLKTLSGTTSTKQAVPKSPA